MAAEALQYSCRTTVGVPHIVSGSHCMAGAETEEPRMIAEGDTHTHTHTHSHRSAKGEAAGMCRGIIDGIHALTASYK